MMPSKPNGGVNFKNARDAAFFVAVSLVNGIAIKWASLRGGHTSHILMYRGFFCALIASCLLIHSKEALRPNNIRTQLLRFLCAGVALLSVTSSYKYLPTTSVALMSRMDIPILMLLAPWCDLRTTLLQKLLSGLSLLVLLASVVLVRGSQSTYNGYALAGFGTLTLVGGYFFLRESARSESMHMVAITPAVACIVFGFVDSSVSHSEAGIFSYDIATSALMAISGLSMFGMYRFSTNLYRELNVVDAQFPAILVPALMLPLEAATFKSSFDNTYAIAVLTVVALMMTAQLLRRQEYGEQ